MDYNIFILYNKSYNIQERYRKKISVICFLKKKYFYLINDMKKRKGNIKNNVIKILLISMRIKWDKIVFIQAIISYLNFKYIIALNTERDRGLCHSYFE